MYKMNTPWQMLRFLAILLMAAVLFACLLSTMLPASASLLAPTATPTRTATSTPSPTGTPTVTPTPTFTSTAGPAATLASPFTPQPEQLGTPPGVTRFGPYAVYWQRDAWERAAGAPFWSEQFEYDPVSLGLLRMPYRSGAGILIDGNGYLEIVNSPQSPSPGNLLHLRAGALGITLTFPERRAVHTFGFDYASPGQWFLTVDRVDIPLPSAASGFVGVIIYHDFPAEFKLSNSGDAPGDLSVDNLGYTTLYVPSTATSTPTVLPAPGMP